MLHKWRISVASSGHYGFCRNSEVCAARQAETLLDPMEAGWSPRNPLKMRHILDHLNFRQSSVRRSPPPALPRNWLSLQSKLPQCTLLSHFCAIQLRLMRRCTGSAIDPSRPACRAKRGRSIADLAEHESESDDYACPTLPLTRVAPTSKANHEQTAAERGRELPRGCARSLGRPTAQGRGARRLWTNLWKLRLPASLCRLQAMS